MSRVRITGQMVVKNEDRYIWYAISSILPYVDKLLISDTGSEDNTLKIIKSFNNPRISLVEEKIKEIDDIRRIRDEQIKKTETDWFWIVDGDEIYPDSLCKEIHKIISLKRLFIEGIVVRKYDLLGDIYHFQSETVGAYKLFGQNGHFVLRLINKSQIPGLHLEGKYPYEGYYDNKSIEITNHPKENFIFTKGKFFHAMYLQRSSLGANLPDTYHRKKWKIETGYRIQDKENIPQVFFQVHPEFVPDVTKERSSVYNILAKIITPMKKIKRKIL